MLFDIRGKRKRVIQVVYAVLAVLFAVSFVGFGIGSDAAGGIFDAFGIGSGNTGSGNPRFEQQVEDAEAELAQNPGDKRALEQLVRVHYQAGNDALELDEETGTIAMTPEAEEEFSAATRAWERYVEATKKASDDVAAVANQAYGVLLQFEDDARAIPTLAQDAVSAAEIVAEANPGAGTYATLAQYAYFAGEYETGDEAAAQAAKRADASQREDLEKQLSRTKKASQKLEKQLAKQPDEATGEEPFSNPLEELGGGAPAPGLPGGGAPLTPPPGS